MHHAYWPLLIFGAFGAITLFFTIRSVRNGVTYDNRGRPVTRTEKPFWFWISILIMSLLSAMFLGVAIFGCVTGGIAM